MVQTVRAYVGQGHDHAPCPPFSFILQHHLFTVQCSLGSLYSLKSISFLNILV